MGPDKEPFLRICYRVNQDYNYIAAGVDWTDKEAQILGIYRDTITVRGYGVIPFRSVSHWDRVKLDKTEFKKDDWNILKVSYAGNIISAALNNVNIGSHTLDDDDIEKIGITEKGRTAIYLQDGKVEINDITMIYDTAMTSNKTAPEKEPEPE